MFLKERQGAYFCPTYIEGGVLSRIYGLDSICRFYYICGQFVLHLSALLHLWSIFITFVVNYYICGFTVKTNVALLSSEFSFVLVGNSWHVPRST